MNRVLAAAACAAFLTISACSSSGSGSGDTSGAGGGQADVVSPPMTGSLHDGMSGTASESGAGEHTGAATITIKDFGYAGDLTVKPGERVTVVNEDSTAHTLTDEDTQLFDTGTITAGGTGSFVAPDRPGQYPFGCIFHPEMSGQLTVQG